VVKTLFLILLAGTVSAQEYIYTYATEATKASCPPYARAVSISDTNAYTNPEYATYTARLQALNPLRQFPLLSVEEGSLIALADGIGGKNLEEIATKRAQLQPLVYTRPIEAPQVIVVSETNAFGIGIAADDEGNLVTFRAHSSPYDPAAAKSNRVAALSKAKAKRDQAKADLSGQLQKRLENIEKILGIRE